MDISNKDDSSDAYLDSLLDEALEDFSKPQAQCQPNNSAASSTSVPPGLVPDGLLTEDIIKQATANFEATMRNIMIQQQNKCQATNNLPNSETQSSASPVSTKASENVQPSTTDAVPPPDRKEPAFNIENLVSEFQQFAHAANSAAASQSSAPSGTARATDDVPDFQQLMNDAMNTVNANNQEFQAPTSPEELGKLLSGLGLSDGNPSSESQLFPLMQSMLENILSKEIMYPPIKDIVDKYPDWLAENRGKVDTDNFDRYSRQYDIMKDIVALFESEKESDSDELKSKRFEDIVNLMQKLQAEGHPPVDLAGEPGVASSFMNSANGGTGDLPDISSLMAGGLLGPAGSTAPQGLPPGNAEEQCCLM